MHGAARGPQPLPPGRFRTRPQRRAAPGARRLALAPPVGCGRMRALARIVLASVLLGAAALAGAATTPLLIPIGGLAGGSVQPLIALRTADGGAILLARVASSSTAATGRLVVARLEADGALDLGYGSEGLVALPLDPRAVPTALAVDPAHGDSWIGASIGRGGPGVIVRLGAYGQLAHQFGSGGVLALPAADAGGPAALDWRSDRLLIAAGVSPCRGCALSVRSAITGHVIRSAGL